MAFITISYQSRRVLVAKPQSLADLLRTAKEIFEPISDDVHLSIEFTDSTGNKAMVKLHESSFSILKDGDATFLIATSNKDNEHLDAALALLSLQGKGEAKENLEEDAGNKTEEALQMGGIYQKALEAIDSALAHRDRFVAQIGRERAAEFGLLRPEEKQEEN